VVSVPKNEASIFSCLAACRKQLSKATRLPMQVNKTFRLPLAAALGILLGEATKPAAIRDLAIIAPSASPLS